MILAEAKAEMQRRNAADSHYIGETEDLNLSDKSTSELRRLMGVHGLEPVSDREEMIVKLEMVLEATDLKLDYVPPKPKTYIVMPH